MYKLLNNTQGTIKIRGHELKEEKSACLSLTLIIISCVSDGWRKGGVGVNQDFTKWQRDERFESLCKEVIIMMDQGRKVVKIVKKMR